MKIFAKTERGVTITLEVEPDTTIEELKQIYYNKENIEPEHQRIYWAGKMLHTYDDAPLSALKIVENCTLTWIYNMRGS